MKLDSKIENVLQGYNQRMVDEAVLMKSLPLEEGMKRRDEFLLSVGEETAVFINSLAKAAQSKIILEIGTSYGYSTIWLAEAAKATNGKVITLENNTEKAAFAKEKINEAGLTNYVEFRVGDALELIKIAPEKFDFVLVDIWKELYAPCFQLFYPKLNSNAWVLSDNMIFPPHHHKETKAYKKSIQEKGTFSSVLLPIGSGIEVSNYKN